MKYKKFFQASALSLLITLSATASVPVLARGGADDSSGRQPVVNNTPNKPEDNSTSGAGSSGTGNTDSSGSGKRTTQQPEVRSRKESENESLTEVHKSNDDAVTELRKKAEQHVAELKKDNKGQSAEKRLEKCQARKQGLENKFERIVTNSQKMQTRIDSILAKAVDYQQANNVQAADFDTLVAAAKVAQAKSAASIANLQALKPSVDCNNASVSTDVAAFKAAAEQVRSDLKDYRKAVKAVLQSLLNAKTTESQTETERSAQ